MSFRGMRGDKVQWKKRFVVANEKIVDIPGAGRHVLKDANTLDIEGKYTAKRK